MSNEYKNPYAGIIETMLVEAENIMDDEYDDAIEILQGDDIDDIIDAIEDDTY